MRATRRNRPARRFAARTALVLLAIGITVHSFVVQTIDQELERQLDLHAEFVTAYLVAPALTAGQTPDDVAAEIVATDPQVTRLTIRDANAAVLGRAGTANVSDVTTDVTIPATDGLRAIVDQDAGVVQGAATDLTRRLALVLGIGLFGLWVAIVPLAYRLGRELRSQADELLAQSVELRRLLDQEQLTVQRLREVDEMRDRFLESISHELRTPITVVKGSLQMLHLKGEAIPPTLRAQLIERASEKADRLSALVQGLLDLNASAEAAANVTWVDLGRAVEDARRALPPLDVELDLDVEGLVTNRAQLIRSLGALLGNVVRHAPSDDPAIVRAEQHGDDVELVVLDRGPGIPADLLEAVFEPFRQGPLLDAHSPGTGIGLSLVAAHAAQHDGRAWAAPRHGGGTEIHVLLRGVVGDPADHPQDDAPTDADTDADRGIVMPVVSERDEAPASPAPIAQDEPVEAAPTAIEPDDVDDEPTVEGRRRVVRRVVVRRTDD